jgi:enoyl-CoA hydratase/carnithine racemase
MAQAPIIIRRSGDVVEIVLNRPKALNALSRALIASLKAAIGAASDDPGLRAIILTGAGRAFCAGIDLKELSRSRDALPTLGGADDEPGLAQILRQCPHPIIAAVNGFAITGGLELALMADFILAAQSARFADTHARVGVVPGWGMTQILPRLIGPNRARQLSLTGDFITADTARDWGLVNEVLSDDALMPRARELAGAIAATDRSTMTRLRDLIALSDELPLAEGLAQELAAFTAHCAGVSPKDMARNSANVTARGPATAGQGAKDRGDGDGA